MKPIRCGSKTPTPYLRKYLPSIPLPSAKPLALDLGAGNLRNTEFAESLGWTVMPIDAAGDNGSFCMDLGNEHLPCYDGTINLFLCDYLMCFLPEDQRIHLVSEIKRTAAEGAYIIVEMFRAKNGFPYNTKTLVNMLGWNIIRISKDRFIAKAPTRKDQWVREQL